jgi:hypothetical protein
MTTVQAYQTTKNTMTIPSETNTNKTEIPNGAAAASVLAEEDVENPDAMPPPPPLTYRERKINHWESSPFAVGCVNVAWADDNPFAKKKEEEDAKMDDRVGWSGVCCNCLGAGRVGNMAVLRHRMEVYETTEINDTTGEATTVNRKRPKLLCTVGPYWPINLCLTWVRTVVLNRKHTFGMLFCVKGLESHTICTCTFYNPYSIIYLLIAAIDSWNFWMDLLERSHSCPYRNHYFMGDMYVFAYL